MQNNLKATRLRLGISQQQLADAAGVTRQTIGGIEAGLYSPSAMVALRLSKALGCQVEELFWLEEDLPVIEAVPVGTMSRAGTPIRVTVAQIGGRWVAHSLEGESAFRTEMIPADGIGEWADSALSVELLNKPANLTRTVVIAGCTPALSLWARSAERWYPGLRVHWIHANSMEGLHCVARGEVHAAGVHLYDATSGEHNVPYVRQILASREVVLINLGAWEEGLLVQPGNPKRLFRGADLTRSDVKVANREPGAGSRMLLDTLLSEDRITPSAVTGYEMTLGSHQDVARSVLSGEVDAGVSTASVAALYGLTFVSVRRVRYDLAVLKEYLDQEPVRQLFGTLHHRWIRSQLQVVGGFDTGETGEVVAQVGPRGKQ